MAAEFLLHRCLFKDSYGWDFGDIVLPQWLVLPRGSNDIVLELFLCSLLTALSIFPFTFGGIPLDV